MAKQTKKPMDATDLLNFAFVSDPQLAPSGKEVAYVQTTIDQENNGYKSQIFIVPVTGGKARAYTAGLGKEVAPKWSPDGQYLAFLSDRGSDQSQRQLYLLPTQGGEARCVTDIDGGVEQFTWSPDGKHLALVAKIGPDGLKFLGDKPSAHDAAEPLEHLFQKFNEDVRHITRPMYRLDGEGWFENKRSHVFVLDVEAVLNRPSGEFARPRQVTDGEYDHQDPAFSPDGRYLALVANREKDADRQIHRDVFLYNLDDHTEHADHTEHDDHTDHAEHTGHAEHAEHNDSEPTEHSSRSVPIKLTQSDSVVSRPSFSPDGRWIAYFGSLLEPFRNTAQTGVWVVRADGSSAPLCVSAVFDRPMVDESITDMRMGGSPSQVVWSPDSDALYVLGSDRGTTHLFRIGLADGLEATKIHRLTSGERVLYGASVLPSVGKAVFAIATPDHPGDLYVADLDDVKEEMLIDPLSHPSVDGGLKLTRLTEANKQLLDNRIVLIPERFTSRTDSGPDVEGWVIRPLGWEPGNKYPAVLEIHGGPMAMYSVGFFLEFQLLAAAGIGVIFTNPRGSHGYGQEFCAAIMDDWGNRDYADLMAATDEALKQFDWIDADRLGVAGGSYGGYMTAWVTAHTDRFKAACVMRPVTNLATMLASDIGYWASWSWAGKKQPWEDPDIYRRQSPITYAGSMKTPTLIICNEEDFRCPTDQSEQLYTALQRQQVEVEYLRYPGESHGMSRSGKPWHRVHRLRHIVRWFTKHLLG